MNGVPPPAGPSLSFLGVLLVLACAVFPWPVEAQTPRELMVQDWERQRAIVVAYVEAMPEEYFGFRPTPEVRSFAEQIEHIVTDHVAIVATAFDRPDRPELGDPNRYLGEKQALLDHVRAGFDWVLRIVHEAPDAELHAEGLIFDRYRVPRWRALEGAREHGTWTLGQVVPYLRLNGVEPPAYQVFPLSTQVEGWQPPEG